MTGRDDLGQPHQGHDHLRQEPPLHDHLAQQDQGGTSHRWLMIACCIPMVVLVAVLVASGVAGTGAIVFAAVCLGLMALMMFAMPGGHDH